MPKRATPRTLTIERTARLINAWMLIVELGVLWSAIAFVVDLVHQHLDGAAHWFLAAVALAVLRMLADLERGWRHG